MSGASASASASTSASNSSSAYDTAERAAASVAADQCGDGTQPTLVVRRFMPFAHPTVTGWDLLREWCVANGLNGFESARPLELARLRDVYVSDRKESDGLFHTTSACCRAVTEAAAGLLAVADADAADAAAAAQSVPLSLLYAAAQCRRPCRLCFGDEAAAATAADTAPHARVAAAKALLAANPQWRAVQWHSQSLSAVVFVATPRRVVVCGAALPFAAFWVSSGVNVDLYNDPVPDGHHDVTTLYATAIALGVRRYAPACAARVRGSMMRAFAAVSEFRFVVTEPLVFVAHAFELYGLYHYARGCAGAQAVGGGKWEQKAARFYAPVREPVPRTADVAVALHIAAAQNRVLCASCAALRPANSALHFELYKGEDAHPTVTATAATAPNGQRDGNDQCDAKSAPALARAHSESVAHAIAAATAAAGVGAGAAERSGHTNASPSLSPVSADDRTSRAASHVLRRRRRAPLPAGAID